MSLVNRWFHPARLHRPSAHEERKVGWLELFYDLVYVATIIQLGNAFSEHFSETPAVAVGTFFALFTPLWLTWTTNTFFANRFAIEDLIHRVVIFTQMFGVVGMGLTLGQVCEGNPGPFAACYAGVRLLQVLMYGRVYAQVPEARDMAARYGLTFAASALLWGVSIAVPEPWSYGLWVLGMMADLSVAFSRQGRELSGRHPPDAGHMTERYGLLTIIVLGESFVKLVGAVSDHGLSPECVLMGGLSLGVTFSLWWIYFDDVANSEIRRTPLGPFIWVYSHLPLTAGITAVGVAIKKVVIDLDPFTPESAKYRWLLCGTLCLTLLCVAVIDAVTARRASEMSDRARVNVRVGAAGVVLLLAPVGGMMDSWAFVALVMGVCLAQVVLDLSMAPLFDPYSGHQASAGPLPARAGPGELPRADRDKLDVRNAVRLGTPSELRRDVYFHLMEGSWTQVFLWGAGAYFFINLIFAALFMLDPHGVTGVSGTSFFEAFSFSVQTFSTIGYGAMSPSSDYAHAVMIVESAVGIVWVAVATGLFFAKASRPRSSVLFSHVMVVNYRNGVPTLTLRAGNARGNELVEAAVRVTVLRDEFAPEGHKLRRLHDLALSRDTTPVFTLSWTIFHPIDAQSPIADLTAETFNDNVVAIIVTLTGHDGTYGQTVHARHTYLPEDVRWNERFVDVLGRTEDGRLLVDYTHFHQTRPEHPPAEE
jgi:inward rectifier potassium channel